MGLALHFERNGLRNDIEIDLWEWDRNPSLFQGFIHLSQNLMPNWEPIIKITQKDTNFKIQRTITKANKEAIKVNYYIQLNGKKGFVSEYFCPNNSRNAYTTCNHIFQNRYANKMPNNINKAVELVQSKPVPKYVFIGMNEKGFLKVKNVAFH